jgi:5-methylcytosine-specific restriction endonuclease McrA
MPLRTCLGCGTPITAGSRCVQCKPARQRNGWKWSHLAAAARNRDGNQCTVEGCTETTNLQVHHRIPIRDGGTDQLSNLTTLCHTHHQTVHR